MGRYFTSLMVFVGGILMAGTVFGMEFQPIGFEPLSMGGAGVASARGSFATYYNPALLAEHRHGVQISISAGVGAREINVVEHIDRLADIDLTETIDRIAGNAPVSGSNTQADRNNVTTIKNELLALSGRNGIQLMPTAALGVQIGNFGFGAYGLSEATASAVVDPSRLDMIVEDAGMYYGYDEGTDIYSLSTRADYEGHSIEYALANGLTYLKLTGLAYVEIPVAYAHKFETPWGQVDVGAAFKIMPGYTFDGDVKIDTESGDISDRLEDADKRDTSWGIDLGLLYKPARVPGLSLGLVGKNLNTPEFDTVTGRAYEVDPQVRAGVAYDCWDDRVCLALDFDLTSNKTFIPDYDAQFVGGGINFHPWSWFSIRGGVMRNIKESDEGTILTAGLGLGLKWFQLDIAGQISTEEGSYDGRDIPRYGRVQVSLVSKWF